MFFGFILIVFYIARGILNYRYYYSLSKFSHFKAQKLSEDLFLQFMRLTYKDFSKKNSSDMTKTIAHETSNFTSLISGFLMMFSEFFIVVFIYSLLLYFELFCNLLLSFAICCSLLLYFAICRSLLLSFSIFCYLSLSFALFCYLLQSAALFRYLLLSFDVVCNRSLSSVLFTMAEHQRTNKQQR